MTSQRAGRLGQISGEAATLFVYGSLRFPDVLRTLLDRVPPSTMATAKGWRVAALRDHVYPVLVPAAGQANGMLLAGLTSTEWATLDAFENDLYQLRRLPLDGERSGWAYVSHDEAEALPHDWDIANFADRELAAYVERCREWRSWYESQA
ncbi:gamma-glutamylcyclotransferase family protein [Saccharothrix luteola]|uniref:gamma-glutamylcyclotransferase family protein n=1 Tax=Saccharothrix luteola TaxID=2893018 RepID=UPI001E2DE8B7|nr:gamma-glutamylcyclotransferase family protein [Saccharothrix luteola]MCC8247662.1 gamma-glutamylcyclotransferase [Saccharothrix luteola]